MTATLYTAGYGNRKPEAFLAALPADAIIIDVRRSASGWSPEYRAKRLAVRFAGRYYHRPALGNVSGDRDRWDSPDPRWVERDLGVIAELLEAGQPICLLCAEKDPAACHRRFIAAALAERIDGLQVEHLLTE